MDSHSAKKSERKLQSSKSKSFLVDTWSMPSPLRAKNAAHACPPLEVKVTAEFKADTQTYVFTAKGDGLKAMEHHDLSELRKLVQAKCAQYHELALSLTLEPWLRVVVSGMSRHQPNESMFRLDVDFSTIQKGIAPDGTEYLVADEGWLSPFPKAHKAAALGNLTLSEMIVDDQHSGSEVSYIPATAEAIKALTDVQNRMEVLRHGLATLLTQEKIAESIPKLAAGSQPLLSL